MRGRAAASVVVALAVVTSGLAALPGVHPSRADGGSSSVHLLTDATPLPRFAHVVPAPSDATIRVGLTLGYRDAPGLSSFLFGVENPGSPRYRHFLSSAAFDRAFGPTAGSVAAVSAALRDAGAAGVELRPGSATVEAMFSPAGFARFFGVPAVEYTTRDGGRAYTVDGTPRLPPAIADLVVGVDGLAGTISPAPASLVPGLSGMRVDSAGPSPGPAFVLDRASATEWFVGSDFTQAYQATALLPGNVSSVPHASYPFRVAVATLLASAYNYSFSTNLPGFDPSVVAQYFADTLAPGWPTPNVTGVPVFEIGPGFPPAPGSFGSLTDSLGMEAENSLDLEMAGSLAPGAQLFTYYFSGSLLANPTALGSIASYLSDDLAAALDHNYGTAQLGVVSCSFGLDDLNSSAWNSEVVRAAAMGVTIVAASGDQGNAPPAASGRDVPAGPTWPATVAFNTSGVMAVGGVSLSLSGTPTSIYTNPPVSARYDPNVQGFGAVRAWFDDSLGFGSYAGSEGGLSQMYGEPYWQFHSAAQPAVVHAAGLQGVGVLGRAEPDVAFPGNTTIGYIAGSSGGSPFYALISGTSIASPVFAGFLADVVGVETATLGSFAPLGYLDPEIYRLASYFAANPGPADPFLDVVNGSNAVFPAAVGWDAVTGWGGLLAPLFLAADENTTERGYVYTGPTPGLPPVPSAAVPLLDLLLLGAVGGGAVAVAVLLFLRRQPKPAAPDVFDPFLLPPAFPAAPGGAPSPYATFACPYCGAARPAEAGPCPSCGIS